MQPLKFCKFPVNKVGKTLQKQTSYDTINQIDNDKKITIIAGPENQAD